MFRLDNHSTKGFAMKTITTILGCLFLLGCTGGNTNWSTVCSTMREADATVTEFSILLEPEDAQSVAQLQALAAPAIDAACQKAADPDAPIDAEALIAVVMEAASSYVNAMEVPPCPRCHGAGFFPVDSQDQCGLCGGNGYEPDAFQKRQRFMVYLLGVRLALRLAGVNLGGSDPEPIPPASVE
jgi:hypothetical protein